MYYQFSAVMVLSEISLWMKSPCTILSHIKAASIINLTLKPVYYLVVSNNFLRPSAPSIKTIRLRCIRSAKSIETVRQLIVSIEDFCDDVNRVLVPSNLREFAQPSHNYRGVPRGVVSHGPALEATRASLSTRKQKIAIKSKKKKHNGEKVQERRRTGGPGVATRVKSGSNFLTRES